MMQQIGYSQVRNGGEFKFWGDTEGECPGSPDYIDLTNGDRVYCPQLGTDYGGDRLVIRMLVYGDTDAITFDGDSVVIIRRL